MKTLKSILFTITFSLGLTGVGWAQVAVPDITLTQVNEVKSFGTATKTELTIRGTDDQNQPRTIAIEKDIRTAHPALNHCRNNAIRVANNPNRWGVIVSGIADHATSPEFDLDDVNHGLECELVRLP